MKLLIFYTFIGGNGVCDANVDFNIEDANDVGRLNKQVAKANKFDEVMITNIIKLPIRESGWRE